VDLPPLAPTLVLVDFSNFVEVCWHPAWSKGQEVGPERAFGGNLKRKVENLSLALGLPVASFWFVKDSHPTAKYGLCPSYKARRATGRPCADRFDPFQKAEEWLRRRNARFLRAPGYEADDAIAAAVHYLTTLPGRRN
jgi:5'-3' exonuclease